MLTVSNFASNALNDTVLQVGVKKQTRLILTVNDVYPELLSFELQFPSSVVVSDFSIKDSGDTSYSYSTTLVNNKLTPESDYQFKSKQIFIDFSVYAKLEGSVSVNVSSYFNSYKVETGSLSLTSTLILFSSILTYTGS